MGAFVVGQRVGDRFVVERLLGAGSSGAVYDVQDERIGRRVALKVLWDPADENSQAWLRLKREVLAAQAIRDPRVIAVHDLLVVEDRPALLMERVEGSSLGERIAETGPLSPDEAARVIEEVLQALALLHDAGIVHRDVKSGNVLIARDGQVKLGDFGLARGEDLGATVTATGTTLGTPGYMAPEVIRGAQATPVSDLYSVGAVLFEILTGRLPFEGTSGMHVAHMHLSEPPPLRLLRERGAPEWLVGVTGRLLEKEPRHRYASANGALAAIRAQQAGSASYKLARLLRQRGRLLGGTFLIAAICAAASIWWVNSNRSLSLSFHDKVLEARTTSGALAWSQTLPRAIQSACFGRFGLGGSPAVACAITWDDKALGDELSNDTASAVWVFDKAGKVLKRIPLLAMGKGISPRYLVNLSSHRFAPGEPERLVVYARHPTWHPTALYVYSLEGREPWEFTPQPDVTFLNSGSIPGWTYQDLDGDGRDDIVCAGINMPVFWADFVAGIKVGAPGEHLPYVTSPDRDMGIGAKPLSYEFFSFEPYTSLRLWKEKGGRILLAFGDGMPWTVGDGCTLHRPGWMGVPAAQALSFNALLPNLNALRQEGRWEELLASAAALPKGLSGTYDALGRLYRATALLGLGNYTEASALALAGEPKDRPLYGYQIAIDGQFLAGRYEDVRTTYRSIPEAVRRSKPELGNTLLFSALYAETSPSLQETGSSTQVFTYDWYPAMLLAAQECLQGDPAAGEHTIRAMGRELDQEAGPRLWLTECLIRQGKLEEARQTLEEAERWRAEDRREFDETQAWLQWCSGSADPALPERFTALVEQARADTRISPRARAFLPVTLARYSLILQSAGHAAEGKKLLAEALKLAPWSWARVLSTRPPHLSP